VTAKEEEEKKSLYGVVQNTGRALSSLVEKKALVLLLSVMTSDCHSDVLLYREGMLKLWC